MISGWKARLSVAAAVLVVAIVSASPAGSGNERVAIGGDPYVVTPQLLRDELARTGLNIRYVELRHQPVPTISGLATRGGESIGFEFQVYPASDQATIVHLGRLRLNDFGWRGPRRDLYYENRIRGVLANVAYAQYEIQPSRNSRTVRTYLKSDRLRRSILRALDDALFRAFPKGDPYAHALKERPS